MINILSLRVPAGGENIAVSYPSHLGERKECENAWMHESMYDWSYNRHWSMDISQCEMAEGKLKTDDG